MLDGAKIIYLEINNTKKVKAFAVNFLPGMTVIGGHNNASKTTILQILNWLLRGNKHKPSNLKRDGSVSTPDGIAYLDNGWTVEYRGKNNTIYVTDAQGNKQGINSLESFISAFALDLPSFLVKSPK